MSTEAVKQYLRGDDRQWHRSHRISHAKLKLSTTSILEEVKFWKEVLHALEGE